MLNHPISIFLDTNIFISQKYDFSDTKNSDFNNLVKMVNDGKIKLYISQIVEHEVKKHIKEDIFEIFKEVKKSRNIVLKKFSKNYSQTSVLSNLFSFYNLKKDDISEEIISKFDKFLKDSKASKLDCKDIDPQQIIVDYMDSNPPFENKEKKKYEFPDAFMIAKLKKICSKESPIYVITEDKGFKEAIKSITGLEGKFDNLKDVFDLINCENEIYNEIKEFLSNSTHTTEILEKLKEEIKDKLESNNIEVDGMRYDRKGICGGFEYEDTEIENVDINNFEFKSVDMITDDEVIVSVEVNTLILVICSFLDEENSIWDPEKKEYMFSTWKNIKEKHEVDINCELTFSIVNSDEKNQKRNYELENIDVDLANLILNEDTKIDEEEILEE